MEDDLFDDPPKSPEAAEASPPRSEEEPPSMLPRSEPRPAEEESPFVFFFPIRERRSGAIIERI